MPHPTVPSFSKLSPSEWRLWCCCNPSMIPPPNPSNPPNPRDNLSLEEFDPGNRLSMSRAYVPAPPTFTRSLKSLPYPPRTRLARPPQTPPPPLSTPTEDSRSQELPPATPHRLSKKPPRTVVQRPTTILLPSPPQRPSMSQEAKVAKVEERKPRIIRMDSEPGYHWWQVGRKMLERREREDEEGGESGERN